MQRADCPLIRGVGTRRTVIHEMMLISMTDLLNQERPEERRAVQIDHVAAAVLLHDDWKRNREEDGGEARWRANRSGTWNAQNKVERMRHETWRSQRSRDGLKCQPHSFGLDVVVHKTSFCALQRYPSWLTINPQRVAPDEC